MAEVRLTKVSKSFGATEVIPPMDLTIEDGSFTVFVGPSGCGKSTLLRMIAGLEDVSGGKIEIGGQDVSRHEPSDRGIAMVFQSYALYPHMSVRKNIAFSLRLSRTPKDEINRRVERAAEILQLGPLLDRKPRELSGGQRQRVAIGRSIVREPKVFLFDEPLSNLDAALRAQMRVELADLHRQLNSTMIYVTHDQVEAMTMADRIVILNAGRVEQVGTPMEVYNRPATEFVAGFIGTPRMNFLTGPAAAQHGAATLGIRPEHIDLFQTDGEWAMQVRHVEHLGSDTVAYLDSEQTGPLTVRTIGQHALNSGQLVWVTPRQDHLHLFDTDGRRKEAAT